MKKVKHKMLLTLRRKTRMILRREGGYYLNGFTRMVIFSYAQTYC